MIVVGLIGGLGNQMFQYAAARALADRLRTDCVLDVRDFAHYKIRKFGLTELAVRARVATKADEAQFPLGQRTILRRLKKIYRSKRWYFEPHFAYDEAWESFADDLYLSGYFQSEKYFLSIRDQLRVDFKPRQELAGHNLSLIKSMADSESVMIHVRRGDYISNPKNLHVHGVCSRDYYIRAIAELSERLASPRYFVFSDDWAWARQNLPIGQNAVFMDGNATSPEIDLYLMTHCRHHIIANSSFSWWGAWLAQDPEQIVITPDPWFDHFAEDVKDLIPSTWLKVAKA